MYTGSVHTMVTAAFSHYDLTHYGSNMLALYYFGRNVGAMMGGTFLLNLYLAAALVASAAHVLWCRASERSERDGSEAIARGGILQSAGRWMEHRGIGDGFDSAWRRTPPALGASGAVNAVVFLNAALFPVQTIYLASSYPCRTSCSRGCSWRATCTARRWGLVGRERGTPRTSAAPPSAPPPRRMRAGAFRRGGFGRGRFGR